MPPTTRYRGGHDKSGEPSLLLHADRPAAGDKVLFARKRFEHDGPTVEILAVHEAIRVPGCLDPVRPRHFVPGLGHVEFPRVFVDRNLSRVIARQSTLEVGPQRRGKYVVYYGRTAGECESGERSPVEPFFRLPAESYANDSQVSAPSCDRFVSILRHDWHTCENIAHTLW